MAKANNAEVGSASAAAPNAVGVGHATGAAPKQTVDALVADQQYPFKVVFEHEHRRPIVVPSANSALVQPKEKAEFTVNSYDQAWGIVMDIAGIAEVLRKEKLGTLTPAAPDKAVATGKAGDTEGEAK